MKLGADKAQQAGLNGTRLIVRRHENADHCNVIYRTLNAPNQARDELSRFFSANPPRGLGLSRIKTWLSWFAFLKAIFGLEMAAEEATIFRRYTGRTTPPTSQAREGWMVIGRRGGKSRISALVAVFLACFRSYDGLLAPGEMGTVMLLGADRRQARVLMRYVSGLLDSIPALASMVVARTAESISLSNRIVIEIHTASFRAVRGYTVVAAICDEIAFWHSEDSANPDHEVLAAIRPAMSTVPGAILLAISSPHARRGAMWEEYKAHYGKDGDPTVVWQGDTRAMNPSVPQGFIDAEYEKDPVSAAAEFGAQFRTDVEAFVTAEAVERIVVPGCGELPRAAGIKYVGFVDFSGGSQDSMTLGIALRERGKVVLDVVREAKPPFSPEEVTKDFCAVLKSFGVHRVTGDRYGGLWPRDRFKEQGVAYEVSDLTKTDIYKAVLPMINSGGVELLDQVRLIRQLTALERSKSRSGAELISHPPGQHDDVINSAAGALVVAARRAMLEGYQESKPPAKKQQEGIAIVETLTRCYTTCRHCGSQHLVDKPGDEPDCPQRGWTFDPAGMRYCGSGPRTIEGLP